MSSNFYLERKLSSDNQIFTETELLEASRYIVILAEPGGGKTRLMRSLSKKLCTSFTTANAFAHTETNEKNVPILIDAFDELAKIDQSGIYKVLSRAKAALPTHVIISSRSSEWDFSATTAFEDILGSRPLVLRLCEFNENEQSSIFEHHLPDEKFSKFQDEISRFELAQLLPNPQFLKLFADAFINSQKHFTDKRSIFEQAVKHLAKEANPGVARGAQTLSTKQKMELSSEVFAKLLLSGAEGISTSEATENRMYPFLTSLLNNHYSMHQILSTGLFKPGETPNQHQPVHRIVAEYCSAQYLAKRIADPTDPLNLSKCLAIIAPNFVVREELRGMLGWMAALGNKAVEEELVKLDPYAVLANGDPSQLEQTSKRLLIQQLKKIENKDPHFRKGDFRRRFSVAGFFSEEVVSDIRRILADDDDGDLRDLVIELLTDSPAAEKLKSELREITLAPNESENTRLLANRCLLSITGYNHREDLESLISEASLTSMRVTGDALETLGPESFSLQFLENYFRACSNLYPRHEDHLERVIGARYFLKNLISELDLQLTIQLLNQLTADIKCHCGRKPYECSCRDGISKIVGSFLDHYFDLAKPPYDPRLIWRWVGELKFQYGKPQDQSKSVHVLTEDKELRQGILAHVFSTLTERKQILDTKIQKFDLHVHSGLTLTEADTTFLIRLAYDQDNPTLWASFIRAHFQPRNNDYSNNNVLRQLMRKQASEKPVLMREWARVERANAEFHREHTRDFRLSRRIKRQYKKQALTRNDNIHFIYNNREQIEAGRHWGALCYFAKMTLLRSNQLELKDIDESIIQNAFRNCIDFIASDVPALSKLAELHCSSKRMNSELVLAAACLEIFRSEGNLQRVDFKLLQALRTELMVHYPGISYEEQESLQAEVDRIIFADIPSAEQFLRQYVEPQLKNPECHFPKVSLLNEDCAFEHLRGSLSLEWLEIYDCLAIETLSTLFEIAARDGSRDLLNDIILDRCQVLMSTYPEPTDNVEIEKKRIFWLVRAFYFLSNMPENYWSWLTRDKDIVHAFQERSGRMSRSDHQHWPKLASVKIKLILEAFVEHWPKVDLPSHWGTNSPPEEQAYRFLRDLVWSLGSDKPDSALPVLESLLANTKLIDFHRDLKVVLATQIRTKALEDFTPPTPSAIAELLDLDEVASVEGLRQLLLEELSELQAAIKGGEFNTVELFYDGGKRLGEIEATIVIAERLSLKLAPKGISITPEHQLKRANRSDFTVSKRVGGERRLLVTEVKGQWHRDLYSAASEQLSERYSIHPEAENQGVYLVLWFGSNETIAGRKSHGIKSAHELKLRLDDSLPSELIGLIDIFVLDVSRK